MGVPGYSTEQRTRLLNDVGWQYDPDLIVVHNIFSDANIDAFQDRDALALADPNPMESAHFCSSRLYCSAYMRGLDCLSSIKKPVQTQPEIPSKVLMPGIPTGENAAADGRNRPND